jgi:hypothetical protein
VIKHIPIQSKQGRRAARILIMAPSWITGSEGVWFAVLNAVVVAIAILSRARPSQLGSPRRGGVTRRASSLVLQCLRSFSIFSYPSACLSSFLLPDAATSTDTQEPVVVTSSPLSRAFVLPSPRPLAAENAPSAVAEEEEEGDPNALSMDEAYALVVASRGRPEHETEEKARRSGVDARAEQFIQGFNDDLRQQRLNSIFNYTQMLKQQLVLGRGRR